MKALTFFFSFLALTSFATAKVVQLSLRDYNVTITTTSSGPLYTVENKSTKKVIGNLTEKQLQASHPEVYDAVKPAIAKDTVIDASLDQSYGKPEKPSKGMR